MVGEHLGETFGEFALPSNSSVGKIITGLMGTEQLIAMSESGERKLEPHERRQCLIHLLRTQPKLSNIQFGKKLGCSEAYIRRLREDIKKNDKIEAKKQAEFFEEDSNKSIFKAIDGIDRQIEDLEASKKKCSKGTRDYVLHANVLAGLYEKRLALLQRLGYVPDNIGAHSSAVYSYKSVVIKGDQIETKPVSSFEEDKKRIEEQKQLEETKVEVVSTPAKREPVVVKPQKLEDIVLSIDEEEPEEN